MDQGLLKSKINTKMFFINKIKTDKPKYQDRNKTKNSCFETSLHPFVAAANTVLCCGRY